MREELDLFDRWSAEGKRVGLVRPRLVRPWPRQELRAALAGKRGVAVVDQNLATGSGGVLHTELEAAGDAAGIHHLAGKGHT